METNVRLQAAHKILSEDMEINKNYTLRPIPGEIQFRASL